MTRLTLILGSMLLIAAAVPAAGISAPRMLVGFQDDPSFRWREERAANMTTATQTSASIVRTTIYWSRVAPTRPTDATDPFDPVYRFDDVDELVRNAATRGMTTLLTIWGTPGWANGDQGENRAPARMSDLRAFAEAVASRYSGRNPGYPFVGYYSIWNEPNLEQFLAPTFNKRGKPVSPGIYAQIARAAYAGIKAGNSRARVAIGETSPRGREKPAKQSRLQDTIAPGTFAHLVSLARPAVRFDAWAHHPYSALGGKPTSKVRFPNVNLTQIPQFETKLRQWFKRRHVPIWVTEYGFETKPGEPKGVTFAQQAAYAKQALAYSQANDSITMFIWFIFRDDPTSTWQSGLETLNGSKKPAFTTYKNAARRVDFRSPIIAIKAKQSNPVIRVPVWELAAQNGVGAQIGATVRTYYNRKNIAVSQPTSVIAIDGYASFRVPLKKPPKGTVYTVGLNINDKNGGRIFRSATLYAF
jgi:Cellulase (glycosyl hydrolase family 5)